MGKPTGFLEWSRSAPARRPVPVRLRDWREVYEPFDRDELNHQAGRCMDCGIPFCNNGCPLGNLIPDWNDLVYRDHWQDAIERLHATNNFPEFTGRLCPAPCESACVLGINQDPVAIKQVEVEIIDRAWDEGWVVPQVPSVRTGKRVAVIGSGPAGLAAAQQLTRAGHDVVVLERADRIGGLLRYGIPEFKMEKRHIDRRLAQMEAEGTEFRTNAVVGDTVDIEVLRASHDAIVLACGATDWRDLPIPGRELGGIHQAMEYLPHANRVQLGDIEQSPIDVQRQARRDHRRRRHRRRLPRHGPPSGCGVGHAARDPAASARDARGAGNPWPQFAMVYKITSAHEEGGDRLFSVNTERFVDDGNGRVRALVLHEVEMIDGAFTKIEGTEQEIPADFVFLALGFVGPEHGSWLDALERRLRPPRQRRSRRSLHELAARHLRRRRHGPRAEPHRVGHRRRARVRRRRRRVPDGRDPAAVAGPPDRPPADVAPGRASCA